MFSAVQPYFHTKTTLGEIILKYLPGSLCFGKYYDGVFRLGDYAHRADKVRHLLDSQLFT